MNSFSQSSLGRRETMRRLALAGLGATCAGGIGTLWARAAQQGAFSSQQLPGGFDHVDHQLGWTKGVQFGGDFMAQEHGYLAQQRINATFAAGGPGTDYRTLVSSGRALVSESNPLGMIEAAIQGQPIVAFAAIYQRDPGCIISPAGKPIRSLRDMIGKTLGLPNSIRGQVTTLMRSNGMDPDLVRFVPVGSDASMLANGQVDGYFNWATTAVPSLTIAGFQTHLLHMDEIGAPGYAGMLIARRDRLEKHFDLFVRYTRALVEGWGWMVRNPDETARIIVEKYAEPGRSLAEQTLQANTIVRYVHTGDALDHGLLWLKPEVFENAIRLARDNGTIPAGMRITPELIMTQDVIKAAQGT